MEIYSTADLLPRLIPTAQTNLGHFGGQQMPYELLARAYLYMNWIEHNPEEIVATTSSVRMGNW